MDKRYFVYILTNWCDRVMYVGVTGDLVRRMYQHKQGVFDGFTKRYRVHKLVYFEVYGDVEVAIAREKQLKGMRRARKDAIVSERNPKWEELVVS